MKVIEVSARKGGVGTTTVACAIAISAAKENPEAKVALLDFSPYGSIYAVLGIGAPTRIPTLNIPAEIDGISAIRTEKDKTPDLSAYDLVVIDAGVVDSIGARYEGVSPYTVSVVRNEYLSLRSEVTSEVKPDAVVGLIIPTNALTSADAELVLKPKHYISWPIDERVSRSIDAGLFISRADSLGVTEWAKRLVSDLTATAV